MARIYDGMSYRQIQLWNKEHLTKDLDQERKKRGLKNVGWEFIVDLYEWLKERISPSNLLDEITKKAAQLKEVEANIKQVIHSVTDQPFEPSYKPFNNISTLIRER